MRCREHPSGWERTRGGSRRTLFWEIQLLSDLGFVTCSADVKPFSSPHFVICASMVITPTRPWMPRVEGAEMQRGLLDAEFKVTADAFRISVDLFAHRLHWGPRALSSLSFPLGSHIACQTESQYPGHCISSVSETNPSLSVRDSWVLQRGSETSQ